MTASLDEPSPPVPNTPAPSRLKALLVLALLVAAGAWVAFHGPAARSTLESFVHWVRGLGGWGLLLFVLVYVAACLLLIPGSWLTLAAGYAFHLGWGTLVVSAGSLLGASAAFWIGRTVARDWVVRWTAGDPRLRAFDQAVGNEGFKIVLLARLSPVVPFSLLNYFLGITRVRFRDFFLASLVGMFPGMLAYVSMGTALSSLTEQPEVAKVGWPRNALFAAGLVATIAVSVVLARIARRALKQTNQ